MQKKKRRTLRAAQKRLSVYYPFPVLVLEILSLLLLADTDAGILFPLAELVLRAGLATKKTKCQNHSIYYE